jgi:hypothetical protein
MTKFICMKCGSANQINECATASTHHRNAHGISDGWMAIICHDCAHKKLLERNRAEYNAATIECDDNCDHAAGWCEPRDGEHSGEIVIDAHHRGARAIDVELLRKVQRIAQAMANKSRRDHDHRAGRRTDAR